MQKICLGAQFYQFFFIIVERTSQHSHTHHILSSISSPYTTTVFLLSISTRNQYSLLTIQGKREVFVECGDNQVKMLWL